MKEILGDLISNIKIEAPTYQEFKLPTINK